MAVPCQHLCCKLGTSSKSKYKHSTALCCKAICLHSCSAPDSIASSAEPCSHTMCYLAGSGAVHCADHRCRLPLLPGSYQHCQQDRAGSRWHNTTGPQCSLCGGDARHDCSLWRRLNQAFHTGSFCSAENILNKVQALGVWFEQFWCWCVCLPKSGHHWQHAKPKDIPCQ